MNGRGERSLTSFNICPRADWRRSGSYRPAGEPRQRVSREAPSRPNARPAWRGAGSRRPLPTPTLRLATIAAAVAASSGCYASTATGFAARSVEFLLARTVRRCRSCPTVTPSTTCTSLQMALSSISAASEAAESVDRCSLNKTIGESPGRVREHLYRSTSG